MTSSTAYRFLSLLASLLSVATFSAQQMEYGLHINSYPTPSQEHTTLMLDEGNPIPFKGKKLTLSFQLRLRPENILGTAVRMITDQGNNIDLLFSIEDDERYPNLVVGDRANLQTTPPPRLEWVDVSLTVDPKKGEAELNYDGVVTKASYPELKGATSVRIAIGHSIIEGFMLDDVASVDVKDVVVSLDNKPIRKWELKGHIDGYCYDDINHSIATAVNPNWIVDENARWKTISEHKFRGLPSVAFDPVMATFYIGVPNNDRLLVYHPAEGVTDTIMAKGNDFLSKYPSQLIYIAPMHTVLSYNIDENSYAYFDARERTWINEGLKESDHDFWNNSVCYNPSDSSLVSFGGYGHYKYNDLLIKSYPFKHKEQDIDTLNSIHPRRSSSTAIVGNDLYIFGGRGCPSGRQELGSRNYYDLYRVNLTDNSTELLWDLNKSPYESDFLGLENMIYDEATDAFLVLTTLDGGTLLRISRKDGTMEKMSYPMGFDINAHLVYGNLFHSQAQNRYYASIITSQTDESTELTIYEIPASVVPVASMMQTPADETCKVTSWKHFIFIGLALLTAIGAVLIWIRRRRQASNPAPSYSDSSTSIATAPSDKETPEPPVSPTKEDTETANADIQDADAQSAGPLKEEEAEPAKHHYDLNRSAVRLFGSFQVFDKNGNDITASFTPTLQLLLIVLILYTAKNPRGISSRRLLEILWGDKEEEAAKNNRNVYISRLRNLLQQIGDVSINVQNGFRNINFGEGTICDYLETKRLLKSNDPNDIEALIELLINGMMLPNMEFEYIDTFKSEFSNEAIEILTTMLRNNAISPKDKVKIADVIFQHDIINEDALYAKCRTLQAQGRIGLAKNIYTAFCKEYKSLMGDAYPHSFNEVLGA